VIGRQCLIVKFDRLSIFPAPMPSRSEKGSMQMEFHVPAKCGCMAFRLMSIRLMYQRSALAG